MEETSKRIEILEIVNSSIHRKSEGTFCMSNPLMKLTETELCDLCRHHIDTFENWSRRIIDETFKNCYGSGLFQLYDFSRTAAY